MTAHINSSISDGVGTILFNRPEVRNAFSPEMAEGFIEITRSFERDPHVRCVLIRGAGDSFMAGGDVKGFHASIEADQPNYAAGLEQRVVNGHLAIHQLRRMPKPVLVCAQGAAAGFGLSIVAAADLAIAADDAYFSCAYRNIGLTADGGISYFLPRIVGERKALEIALLGERFSAQQALAWGVVNWLEPMATLAERALTIALSLADGPGLAQAGVKRLFRNSLDNSWEQQSMLEAESVSAVAATTDHREGVAAFMEKRKARFVGR